MQVLRASPLFVWRNEAGVPWRDVIRDSARTEFDAARRAQRTRARAHAAHTQTLGVALTRCALFTRSRAHALPRRFRWLTDPEEVNRLLISGRDYLDQTLEMARRKTHTQKRSHTQCKALSLLLTRAPRAVLCVRSF
jgi:hypothetical protein